MIIATVIRKRRPVWPQMVITGLAALLLLTSIVRAGTPARPQGPPARITVEGDDGVLLTLGVNDRGGLVSIVNPHSGLGTIIPVPLPAFFDLVREISNAPSHLPSIQVPDIEQTLFATPVTIKEGVGGVVMMSLTRVSGRPSSPHPVLSLYARRGDEKWDNRMQFSYGRLERLVGLMGRFLAVNPR